MSEDTGPKTFKIERTEDALMEAPTIFIDGAQGLIGNDQIVKFNLYQHRLVARPAGSKEPPIERVICARLIMTPLTLAQLAKWLVENLQKLKIPTQTAG